MSTNNPNRYRVSRKLTLAKIIIWIFMPLLICSLVAQFIHNTITIGMLFSFMAVLLIFSVLLHYVSTSGHIEYDDIQHILYVFDATGKLKYEIPVEKINSITHSGTGFDNLGKYYVISFKNIDGKERTTRFYTIPFRKDINSIIIDTKLKNPRVLIY